MRQPSRTASAAFIGLLLGGCTITQPVPEAPRSGGFFTVLPAALAASAVPLSLPPGTDLCVALPTLPACFADGLGEAIEWVDQQRQAHLARARAVSNGNASYNALLYPFGAAAVYEKLRGATTRNLLLPSVVAAAVYGYMNSGVSERERHYLRAAVALHCAVLRQAEWLYRRDEIEAKASVASQQQHDRSLERVIIDLRNHSAAFASARLSLLGKLKAPKAAASPAGAIDRRKAGSGPAAAKDLRGDIMQRTQDQLQQARLALAALDDLRAGIRSAAWRLSTDAQALNTAVQKDLSDKVPLPRDPQVVAKDFKAMALALAQAGEQDAALMDPVLPAALLKQLDEPTAEAMVDFGQKPGVQLAKAYFEAQRWVVTHKRRGVQSTADQQALGCDERLPALAVVVPPAASAPASSNGTGKGSGSGSGSGQATQTPLPGAAETR